MRRPLIAKVVMVNNRKPVRNMLTKTNPKPNKLPVIITDESGSPIQLKFREWQDKINPWRDKK